MNEFDRNILIVSENICKNIASITDGDRGFKSQNILSNLRHLVEAVDQRIFSEKATITLNKYDDIERSVAYVASRGELKFLNRFHYFLQAAVSHFIPDEDGATRLMLKYYEWLLRIREYVKNTFGLDILQNLEDYPLDQDESLNEYYEKIAYQLEHMRYSDRTPSDRFYVQKSKPFFSGGKIYYEITVIPADDYSSKFNRFTVFSKNEIPIYYAIKLNFIDTEIGILKRHMPIRVIDNYKVAIRPVEFDDFSRILNMPKVNAGTIEYNSMMEYLTVSGMSLTELVTMSDEYYGAVKTKIQNLSKSNNLFNSLDRCRQLIKSNAAGSNILRYILLKMRHRIMRYQIADRPNNWISYLSLWNECIPFDKMPFDASLVYHNPSLFDVFSCISSKGREHEILSRKIRINTEQNVKLFTPIKDVEYIGNVQELANKFNTLLISKHVPVRSLVIEKDNVYIKGYEADTVTIINDLISRVGNGLTGYRNAMGTWLQETPTVDCEEKESILLDMFSKYDLALIYGAAGTGKTTLIKHLSSYFADSSKLFLANTNPAKENLRRQIKVSNSEFSTIASCSSLVNGNNYDIVFIDECSTVDNAAMKELLKKLNCRLLVLVGDVYQIRSIKFGNWFSLARYFLPSNIVYELNTPYRSKHSSMVELWNKVRSLDERTEEYIAIQHYASELDDSIFVREDSDEIILCLNYDGLYGINNINRFLQNDNQSPAVYWDSWIYKVGDPVIFSENNRFYPTLYNNLKGWIRHIKKETAAIQFDIEVDMALTEFAAMAAGFDLLECDVPGHSLIRFTVDHYIDDDGREKNSREVVPFQVAYAISIHKAQGLEYNSVKVVVTNEIEEQITHNIFYTAITRACKNLKIYWTPETQHKVLTEMKPLSCKSDAFVISNKYNIPITNRNG
ncbi:AAA family ATPase [Eubacterium sp.]